MEREALSPSIRLPPPDRLVRELVPFMMTVPAPSRAAFPVRLVDRVSVVPSATRRMPGPVKFRLPPEMVKLPPETTRASVLRVSPPAMVSVDGPLVTSMEA